MAQNRDSGAKANAWGREAAALVSKKIGAQEVGSDGNEFEWKGERITIRMASEGTRQVGVTYSMLERVKTVIAAFGIAADEYELIALPAQTYKKFARPSVENEGKIAFVGKKAFNENGRMLARIRLQSDSIPVRSWIFQAVPDRYDILSYVAAYDKIYWSVGHVKIGQRVAKRDEVFIWKAYGKAKDFAGVVAHGVVVEPEVDKTEIQNPENLGNEFWKAGASERSRRKVGVQLDSIATNAEGALLREKLVADGLLGESQIIKARTGTLFLLTPEQGIRLRELWAARGLVSVQNEMENAGEFQPANQEDAKKKVLRLIALRLGQPKFRKALLAAYQGRCAVTGTFVENILEAAHIIPYKGESTNHVCNGLLLRSDIHALFDLGLLSVEPRTLCVQCSQLIMEEQAYAALHGRKLRMPSDARHWPDSAALQSHFDRRTP